MIWRRRTRTYRDREEWFAAGAGYSLEVTAFTHGAFAGHARTIRDMTAPASCTVYGTREHCQRMLERFVETERRERQEAGA